MTPERKRFWGVVSPQLPAAVLAALGRQLESQGVEGVFAPQVYGPGFAPLAAVASSTSRLRLATGVALAFVRSPFETAMAAIDLDRMSGGRFVLGLGPSIRSWSEGFFASAYGKPLAHLREVVEVVRLVVAGAHRGELGRYEGTYYRFDWSELQPTQPPFRERIPIWIGALRLPLVRLAAEVGDGLIGHPLWSYRWLEEEVVPNLDAALAQAGRGRENFHVNAWVWVAPTRDVRQALDDCRPTLAFYGGMKQYEPYFEAHGFGEVARKLQEGIQRGAYLSVVEEVPDEMVRELVLVGEEDEVRAALERYFAFADSVTPVPPAYGMPQDRLAAYIGAVGRIIGSG